MLTLTHRLPAEAAIAVHLTLALTAEERTRSRYQLESAEGQKVRLQLPRGTVLHHGDRLQTETGDLIVQITAKPEPVLTVSAQTTLELLRAAYHLGNRHVALEITPDYLRLSPDPVLKSMLEHLGLQVVEEIAAFQPEVGAYGHSGLHHAH
jgi:urease accessory protein